MWDERELRVAIAPCRLCGALQLPDAGSRANRVIMDLLEHLNNIEAEMDEILGRFKHTRDGVWIANGDQAAFMGLVLEAEDLLNEAFGTANSFSLSMRTISANGRMTYSGSQNYSSVEQTLGVLRSAIRKATRGPTVQARPTDDRAEVPPYVSGARLNELRALRNDQFDFRRLVRMCEELNDCFAAKNFIAVAGLLRAIKDHVPPALGAENFLAYVAQQNGRSHKGSMERLGLSLKHIADQWLHGQIRSRETVPTAQQVDFRQDMDVLLGEIVRLHQ